MVSIEDDEDFFCWHEPSVSAKIDDSHSPRLDDKRRRGFFTSMVGFHGDSFRCEGLLSHSVEFDTVIEIYFPADCLVYHYRIRVQKSGDIYHITKVYGRENSNQW